MNNNNYKINNVNNNQDNRYNISYTNNIYCVNTSFNTNNISLKTQDKIINITNTEDFINFFNKM